jgi:hypothetical protein
MGRLRDGCWTAAFLRRLVHLLDSLVFVQALASLSPSCAPIRSFCLVCFARYAIMIPKGYRFSLSHLFFYISTFIITTQLWSIWRQSTGHYLHSYLPRHWHFDPDAHANIHTFSHEQCDTAFPQLYHSLDQAVSLRQGRKVHSKDIEISKGRCMLRVMIYQGEVWPPRR